jgi:hypothetical protein
MSKHYKNGRPASTELTWEERNPTSYIYRPSKDVKGLIKIVNNERGKDVRRQKERK